MSIFQSQIHLNLTEEGGVRRGEKENEAGGRRKGREKKGVGLWKYGDCSVDKVLSVKAWRSDFFFLNLQQPYKLSGHGDKVSLTHH